MTIAQQYNSACPYDNNIRDTFGVKAYLSYVVMTLYRSFNIRDNDSHISLYTHGVGQSLAFNDDQCSNYQYHSTVIFSPHIDGV